jgi:hypothetical protein
MISELQEIIRQASQIESLSVQSIITTMFVAVVCGLIIYLTYRYFYSGDVYNENFNILLMLITTITAFIIVTIGANLVLSLGMVGALSIVRFRAAVKDPLDVGFLYWCVAAGLTAGAKLYLVALIITCIIAALYILMTFIRSPKGCYLMILRYAPEYEEKVQSLLKGVKSRLKNRTHTRTSVELTLEVRGRHENLMEPFTACPEIDSAVLVEYNS